MTRALLWSLVGSAATVITIELAPSIQILNSIEESATLLGHRITIRLDVAPQPAAKPGPYPATHLLALGSATQRHCMVIP